MGRTLLVVSAAAILLAGCASEGQKDFFRYVEMNNLVEVKSDLAEHPDWLELRNERGRTPLCHVAYRGIGRRGSYDRERKREVADFLLAEGADVNAIDEFARGPLYWFASHADKEFVKKVIDRGAQVNHRDKYGRTPLHVAAKAGHVDVAKLLLAHGAEVNPRDEDGHTPLYLAVKEGHEEMAALLREHGATKE